MTSVNYDFSRPIRIATRQSPLALWQAEHVQARLRELYPEATVELLKITTQGDVLLDSPLSKIGGKGLFIKELEVAMLEGKADIAVHSMKDVPAVFPEGFVLASILSREAPHDAFVSSKYADIDDLPRRAIVGTCSLRRSSQLLDYRPDLQIHSLRGNVGTRLGKLDSGEFDAIILAQAGLIRLGLEERIRQVISDDISLPAVGQGAVGIECVANSNVIPLVAALADEATTARVLAERAMNRRLEGGCQVPIAGYSVLSEDGKSVSEKTLHLRGLVATTDGKVILRAEATGSASDPEAIGLAVAESLLDQGAKEILDAIKAEA